MLITSGEGNMKKLLPGKVAIINGGASGMGKATALLFAEEGCSCVIADINEAEGKKTAAAATKNGRECAFFKCDLTDLTQIRDCVAYTVKKFGKVDILVGCAGGSVVKRRAGASVKPVEKPRRGIQNIEEEYYDLMMALNLKGHVFFCKEVAPYMIKQKYGKIVFISSQGVYNPPGPATEYHSAKAGILGLMYNLAYELAPQNITVNAILPGPVKTPFWDPVLSMVPEGERDAALEKLGQSTPLGRIGQPEDIANAVLFLSSELSSFITGQALNVGGGIPLSRYVEGGFGGVTKPAQS
jgi:NAD(P)-dependent dehydrogenase (short-subunit alcohol dehydrogenase family)